MARLAVSLAGAAVGGFIGGPTGARLGFTIGSFIGGQLFPDPPTVVEGPRLGDLNVASSTQGSPIPLGYGTLRMAGNLIWAGDVQEVENRQETGGGKGAPSPPSQVQVTYSYFADFAIAFAEGPAKEVIRIWMDKKLVVDRRGQGATKQPGISYRFYKGNETQTADPTISAKEGAANTPANRGLVYIVFNNLDISQFGNRLPQVEAEIAFDAVQANSDRFSNDFTVGEGGIFSGFQSTAMEVDHRRRRIYTVGSGANDGLRVYDLDSLQEIRQKEGEDITGPAFGGGPDPTPIHDPSLHVGQYTGCIYFNAGAANSRPVIKADPDTLKQTAKFGFESAAAVVPATGPVDTLPGVDLICEISLIDAAPALDGGVSSQSFLLMRGILGTGRLFILRSSNFGLSYLASDTVSFNAIRGFAPFAEPSLGQANGWMLTQVSANSAVDVYKVTIQASATTLIDASTGNRTTVGVDVELIDTIDPSVWSSDASDTVKFTLDKTDGGLIFVNARSSSTGAYISKWREGEGILWTTEVNSSAPPSERSFPQNSVLEYGTLGIVDTNGQASLIDTIDGSIIVNNFDWNTITVSANPDGPIIYDGRTQSVIALQSGAPGAIGQLFLNRATGLGTTDGAIITALSARVGMDTVNEIDVAELTNTVRGFAVSRRMAARTALETLGTAFLWDGVESDGKVVYKLRGRATERSIDDTEMVPLGENVFAEVVESRAQEVELPEVVSITYMDIDRDYQAGNQSSKRILEPAPSMRSRNKSEIPMAIVFNGDEARQITEKILFTAWNERVKFDWKTSWEHLDLDPADVVELILNGATTTTVRARIASMLVGRDLSISFSGFREDQVTVVSDASSTVNEGFTQQVIPGPFFTRLFLLDIPLLRDVDDLGRTASRLHFAMNGYTDNWPGGSLFTSQDAVTFSNTGLRNPLGVAYGAVINTLPATETPFLTDKTTQLQVLMFQGELESLTDVQFLLNSNVAVVGNPDLGNWEIIRFQNAVQQSDSSYILTTLRRGRRGTEVNVNSHDDGEMFILLERDTVNSLVLPTSLLNSAQFYKAVGDGQLPENADVASFASTMADLKPRAPAHFSGVLDGSSNVDLAWVRRTRVGGALRDQIGDVPLAEDSEEYEVDINEIDADFASIALLLSLDGVDAATETTDESPSPKTITFFNDAQLDTAQFKFGTASLLCDGTTDYIEASFSDDFDFADGEFTIECHVRFNSLTGQQPLMGRWKTTGELSWMLSKEATTDDLRFSYTTDGSTEQTLVATWAPSTGVWYHVAVDRDASGDVRIYVDGAVVAGPTSITDTFDWSGTSEPQFGGSSFESAYLNGWLDNIRVTNGAARYGGAFTAPVQPFPNVAAGVVRRTLTSTDPLVQYDNADIITDFGAVPATLNATVYQMSAQVGRGFGKTETFTL